MPEGEPCPQRLAHIDHQDCYRPAIADEPDHHRRVQNRLELGTLQDVNEESGEERARPQCDDSEIKKNPKTKGEAVVHIRLVQPVVQAQTGGIDSDGEKNSPGRQPQQKSRERGSLFAPCDPLLVGQSAVGNHGASHVAPPTRLSNQNPNSTPPALSPTPPSTCNKPLAPFRCAPAGGMHPESVHLARPDHFSRPGCQSESLQSGKLPRRPGHSRQGRSPVCRQRRLSALPSAAAHDTDCISPPHRASAMPLQDSDSSPCPRATSDPTN